DTIARRSAVLTCADSRGLFFRGLPGSRYRSASQRSAGTALLVPGPAGLALVDRHAGAGRRGSHPDDDQPDTSARPAVALTPVAGVPVRHRGVLFRSPIVSERPRITPGWSGRCEFQRVTFLAGLPRNACLRLLEPS